MSNIYNIQNGLIVLGNITASTYYGYLDWSYITSKPTTISGYGITDAVLLSTYNTYTGTTVPSLIQGVNNNLTAHTSLVNPHQTSFFDLVSTAHTHIKSMISDFVEGDYVHITGTEILTGYKTFQNNVTVLGNLYVSGTTVTINTENMAIKDNLIIINSGETNSGVTKIVAGFQVDRGVYNPYYFLFDESQQNFRVGQGVNSTSAITQAVATREDSPSNSGVAFWNATNYRFDTSNNLTWNGSKLHIIGSISATTIYANIVGNVEWSSIQNTPTTIIGYGILDAYTTAQTNSNFLSANTSFYTQSQSNSNFLSSTTTLSYFSGVSLTTYNSYTANTYNTLTSITNDFNNYTGTTIPSILNGYYTSSQTNSNFLSANTSYYTQQQVDNFITGVTSLLNSHTGNTNNPHQTTFNNLVSTAHTHLWTDINNRFVFTNLSSNTIIDSFSTSLTDGCHWNYVVKDGVNVEAGTIIGVWELNTSASTYTQYSTDSLGNTNGITFNINVVGNTVNLLTNITSGNWNIKMRRLSI